MANAESRAYLRFSEMEPRGWSRDLVRIHLPDQSGWYIAADVRAAERTASWKRDAARVAKGLPVTLSRADLRARGWSAAMIRDLLGDPPIVIDLDARGRRTFHLFLAVVVEEIEAGPAFEELAAAAARRSAAGRKNAARRAGELRAEVEARAERLRVNAPSSLQALENAAIEHQQDLYDMRERWGSSAYGADAETIDRWCRNYLRHERSNYDALLDRIHRDFAGVPGVNDVYERIVRPRIDVLVDDVIEDLRAKARRRS